MDRCILSKLSGKGVPDRVNIPCLMHDTRLCQLDVTMTNNYHGTNSIEIQNMSRYKNRCTQYIRPVKRPDTRSLVSTWC